MKSILFYLLPIAFATVWFGSCPSMPAQQNFDINRFLGVWHEEIRDKDIPYENGICNTFEYTKDENDVIQIVGSEIIKGNRNNILGSINCVKNTGKCTHTFFSVSPAKNYNIVMTDYENVSIVHMCTSYYLFHISYAWVLTRNIGESDLALYAEIMQDLGIKAENLYFTDNQNCPLL